MNLRLRFLTISLALLTATLAFSQQSVPFTLGDQLTIQIHAKVNGVEFPFLLDLGAGLDALSGKTAQQVNAQPTGVYTGFRMGGERLDARLATVGSLQFGPLNESARTVSVVDVLDEIHIAGLISARMFERQPVTIDFVHKVIRFETADSLKKIEKTASVVPLNTARDRGKTLDLFATFNLAGQKAECLIDTGLTQVSINERWMEPLKIAKDSPLVKVRDIHSITGAPRKLYHTTLPVVSIDGVPAAKLENAEVNFSDIIYDCVLGNGFWLDKAVTLDIPRNRILVTVADAAKP